MAGQVLSGDLAHPKASVTRASLVFLFAVALGDFERSADCLK
jgi:hypothetical protein